MKLALLFLALLPAAFGQGITVRQAMEIANGIAQLDSGGTKLVDGKPVNVPFQFSANTRWTLAVDSALVRPVLDTYQATNQKIILSIDKMGVRPDNVAEMAALVAAVKPILEGPAPIVGIDGKPGALRKISLADLQLDSNPIPTQVLVLLQPIIVP